MSQVNVSINGRQFRMACEDGQEDHLQSLAKDIDDRINGLRGQFGEIGDSRLTVMAAITVADELSEARQTIRRLQNDITALQEARETASGRAEAAEAAVARTLEEAAARIEVLAKRLNQVPPAGDGLALG